MLSKSNVMVVVLVILAFPRFALAQLPVLSFDTVDDYQTAIEPTAIETSFLSIPWYSQLHSAVRRAHRDEKPLLIYVMNGHPLACT